MIVTPNQTLFDNNNKTNISTQIKVSFFNEWNQESKSSNLSYLIDFINIHNNISITDTASNTNVTDFLMDKFISEMNNTVYEINSSEFFDGIPLSY